MATLLSICRRVVRGTGILAPSAIAGSNDETAERLLEAAQLCGELMFRAHPWVVLVRENTTSLVNGTAEYSLPSDFDRILADTAWHADAYWRLRGNLGPAEWQWRQNVVTALPATRKAFRIRVSTATKKLFIHPTPDASEDVVYEYVSSGWNTSSGGTRQSAWAADTDILLLDEAVFVLGARWLFKQSNGLPYLDDRALWQDQMDLLIAQEVAPPPVDFGVARTEPLYPNVPDGNFGS